MIITVEDIRKVRDIARNIDEERVNVFIREAEVLDIIPEIGAELYERFNQIGKIVVDAERADLETEAGEDIYALSEADLTTEEHKFLYGGYYTDDCGKERYISGIKEALCYFAYARLVRNAQINVTRYGVVTKLGEESEPTSQARIAATAADALNIGKAMLADALRYWRKYGTGVCCHRGAQRSKRKFLAIGK